MPCHYYHIAMLVIIFRRERRRLAVMPHYYDITLKIVALHSAIGG